MTLPHGGLSCFLPGVLVMGVSAEEPVAEDSEEIQQTGPDRIGLTEARSARDAQARRRVEVLSAVLKAKDMPSVLAALWVRTVALMNAVS